MKNNKHTDIFTDEKQSRVELANIQSSNDMSRQSYHKVNNDSGLHSIPNMIMKSSNSDSIPEQKQYPNKVILVTAKQMNASRVSMKKKRRKTKKKRSKKKRYSAPVNDMFAGQQLKFYPHKSMQYDIYGNTITVPEVRGRKKRHRRSSSLTEIRIQPQMHPQFTHANTQNTTSLEYKSNSTSEILAAGDGYPQTHNQLKTHAHTNDGAFRVPPIMQQYPYSTSNVRQSNNVVLPGDNPPRPRERSKHRAYNSNDDKSRSKSSKRHRKKHQPAYYSDMSFALKSNKNILPMNREKEEEKQDFTILELRKDRGRSISAPDIGMINDSHQRPTLQQPRNTFQIAHEQSYVHMSRNKRGSKKKLRIHSQPPARIMADAEAYQKLVLLQMQAQRDEEQERKHNHSVIQHEIMNEFAYDDDGQYEDDMDVMQSIPVFMDTGIHDNDENEDSSSGDKYMYGHDSAHTSSHNYQKGGSRLLYH